MVVLVVVVLVLVVLVVLVVVGKIGDGEVRRVCVALHRTLIQPGEGYCHIFEDFLIAINIFYIYPYRY